MHLFWHQRDLRVRDNHGLHVAARDDAVLPVYVVDEAVLSTVGRRKRAFLAACVRSLDREYGRRGGGLVVREGSAEDVLPELADEYGADAVVWNDHYQRARRNRQRRVAAACARAGIDADGRTDLVLVDPGKLPERHASHRQFHDDWQVVPKTAPYPEPDDDALVTVDEGTTDHWTTDDGTIDGETAENETTDGETTNAVDLPEAGYDAARRRLDAFLADGVRTYAETRDDLSLAVAEPTRAVSRLSPYLAAGAIGIREVWRDVSDVYDDTSGSERRNVDKYRDELTWRERNYHLLYHEPDLRTANYRTFPNDIEWRNDEDALAAWTAGETGYPLVDAGMRQLEREGYVHNRPRQVVASFLTKHLLVDWRRGERHFADRLVDYDPASNAGNWQWTASTGTDTVAVRIFDPVSQMAKYDPDADYVVEYVPELRGVPAEKVVEWPTLRPSERDRLAPDYPHPIVDRDGAYDRATAVFETALGKR